MGLTKRPGSDNWYIEFIINGRRHKASSNTTDKNKTRRIEAKMRADLLLQDDPAYQSKITLAQAITRYIDMVICAAASARSCIARNRRRETPAAWLEIAKEHGVAQHPRAGKTVWLGETTKEVSGVQRRVIFEVTERTTQRIVGGFQELLVPGIDLETFWTDLADTPADIIDFYHGRGTSEQFHRESKTDLDLERLPSGTFATNQLVLLLGMLAYNSLRLAGQGALRDDPGIRTTAQAPLRKRVKRRRIRSVMDDLIHLAARVIHTGRRWRLAFGRQAPWAETWERIYRTFLNPAPA